MNTNKKAALGKRIDETKKKIAALREQKAPAAPSIGVAFLIETDMEKASLIMAAKNIVADLQSNAEKIAKVEVDQLMPVIDQLKATFGTSPAESFYRASTQALRDLVDQIQKTKDAIADQITRLESGAAGLPMNDMQMDGGDDEMAPPAEGGDDLAADADLGDEMGGDDLGGEEVPGAEDVAPEAPEDDAFADEMTSAAGRARKESAEKFDRAILEYFGKAVKLGHRPTAAAKMVAEGFKVEVADVKELVREAANHDLKWEVKGKDKLYDSFDEACKANPKMKPKQVLVPKKK